MAIALKVLQVGGKVAAGAAKAPAAGIAAAHSAGLNRSSGLSRVLTALFVGAIVLEVMAYVTGQYFTLDWRGLGQRPLQPAGATDAYRSLYQGQAQVLAAIATGQAPATMAQQSQAAQLLHAGAPIPALGPA